MAINKPNIFQTGIYFVTFTNYNWIPLFELTNSYDLVYKWFDFMKTKGHDILGYVIMPNHLHVLIGLSTKNQSLNTIVGNGKRFIAYGIIERLLAERKTGLLKTLSEGVKLSEKKRGKLHELFEPSFDAKLCYSYEFIRQKLDYIHSNPVSKKWNLVKEPSDYIHGSAKYYLIGVHSTYEVMNCNDWINAHWFEGEKAQNK